MSDVYTRIGYSSANNDYHVETEFVAPDRELFIFVSRFVEIISGYEEYQITHNVY